MRSTTTTRACVRAVPATGVGDPRRAEISELTDLARSPWALRARTTRFLVRPGSPRDIAAVAQLHSRCSARSLLDRYRAGGRAPAVAALDWALRNPYSVVVVGADGDIVATASLQRDPAHGHQCAEVGVLVEDRWQHRGVGGALMGHLAGVAAVAGFTELIAYPATAVPAVQRLMIEIGRTRMVPDVETHLHTYLPDDATLGLGSVRQRLAG